MNKTFSSLSLDNETYEIKDAVARNEIKKLNTKTTIMIGDSYGVGTTNETEITTGWCDLLKEKLCLSENEYYKYVENGSGFVATGVNGNTFLSLLQQNTIEDKSIVKTIIICGGYNDRNAGQGVIENSIGAFMDYVKANFTNATVYLGMVANDSQANGTGYNNRLNLGITVLPAYKNIINYGGLYLNGVETCLKYYPLFSNDNYHPNITGYKALSSFIYQAIKTGMAFQYTKPEGGTIGNHTSLFYNNTINGNISYMVVAGSTNNVSGFDNSQLIDLGVLNDAFTFRSVRTFAPRIPCKYKLTTTNGECYGGEGELYVNENNHLILVNKPLLNNGQNYLAISNIVSLEILECGCSYPTIFA